jgi:hypothetical protein
VGHAGDATPAERRAALEGDIRHQEVLLADAQACNLHSLAQRRLRRLRDLRRQLARLRAGGK